MKFFKYLILFFYTCFAMACGSADGEDVEKNLASKPNWQKIYETNKDKTVLITSYYDDGSGSEGSGFFVKDNVIVTNYHVVTPINLDSVYVTTIDESVYVITEMDLSLEHRDIAFLKFPGKKKPVALGKFNNLNVLDGIMHIGNPLALHWTANKGIVSAVRKANSSFHWIDDDTTIVQTDISCDHGSSGGAIFDATGNAVAVMFSIYSSDDILGDFRFGVSIDYVTAKLHHLDFQPIEDLQLHPEVALLVGRWHIFYTTEEEHEEIYTFYAVMIQNYKTDDFDYIISGEDYSGNEIYGCFDLETQQLSIFDEELTYEKTFYFDLDSWDATITNGILNHEKNGEILDTYAITGYKEYF